MLLLLILLGSIVWVIAAPDFEPAIAVGTSLLGVLGNEVVLRKKKHAATMAQSVQGNAIGIQAGGDNNLGNIDHGRQNAYKLSEVAMKTVSERVEKITNDFFSELLAKNSNGVAQAQDPDFQYVFLQAQTSYARSGAADLEQLLVDLLVDRIGAAERDILQIVLNESLATVSKLTDSHIATLAVAFFFQHVDCRPHGLEQFGTSLDDVVERHRHSQIIWSRYCVSAWRDYLCKALLPNFFVHEA
eukprot:gene26184-32720_t